MTGTSLAACLLASAALGASGPGACRDDSAKAIAAAVREAPAGAVVPYADALLDYFSFEAYARQDVELCAALSPIHSEQAGKINHGDDICRTKYHELNYVRAIVTRSPDRERLCVADQQAAGVDLPSARRDCRLREKMFDIVDPAPTLAKIEAACRRVTQGKDAKQTAKCIPYTRAFEGDDDACSEAGGTVDSPKEKLNDEAQCRSFAAFRRAYVAGKPGLCGGLAICRALMGGGRDVAAEYAARLGPALCRLHAAPSPL